MHSTLKEYRDRIKKESPNVGKLPYSHNIIAFSLRDISRHFGVAEANKAIRDFKLDRLGWIEQIGEEPDPTIPSGKDLIDPLDRVMRES